MSIIEDLNKIKALHQKVRSTDMTEPDSMIVATQSKESGPSLRVVLVKDISEKGIIFYTNLGSRKSKDLLKNPQICIMFDWKVINIRVKVKGQVEAVSNDTADRYFSTRGRKSQIGAWASKQSQPLLGLELQKRILFYTSKFIFRRVSRPKFWSGYIVRPTDIEFITL